MLAQHIRPLQPQQQQPVPALATSHKQTACWTCFQYRNTHALCSSCITCSFNPPTNKLPVLFYTVACCVTCCYLSVCQQTQINRRLSKCSWRTTKSTSSAARRTTTTPCTLRRRRDTQRSYGCLSQQVCGCAGLAGFCAGSVAPTATAGCQHNIAQRVAHATSAALQQHNMCLASNTRQGLHAWYLQ